MSRRKRKHDTRAAWRARKAKQRAGGTDFELLVARLKAAVREVAVYAFDRALEAEFEQRRQQLREEVLK